MATTAFRRRRIKRASPVIRSPPLISRCATALLLNRSCGRLYRRRRKCLLQTCCVAPLLPVVQLIDVERSLGARLHDGDPEDPDRVSRAGRLVRDPRGARARRRPERLLRVAPVAEAGGPAP